MKFLSRLGWVTDLPTLRRAYVNLFRSPTGAEQVLPDLAEFCHANDPLPLGADERTAFRYEGRRDVWLHIREYLDLSDDELADIWKKRSILSESMKEPNR